MPSEVVSSKYLVIREAYLGKSWYSVGLEVFFKGWYAIALLKLLLIGPLYYDLYTFQLGEASVFGEVLRILIAGVLLAALVIPRNYLMSILTFAMVFVSHQVIHPVVNGGDLVLLFFMFLGIFCNQSPGFSTGSVAGVIQIAFTNFSVILGRIQIAVIYLVSGWDKLISQPWRDGTALYNLLQVDFYPASWVKSITQDASLETLMLVSWVVIIFELSFPIFIWWSKTRYFMLAAGIMFHSFIGFGLSLPDFALVMIWCYLLFVLGPRKF